MNKLFPTSLVGSYPQPDWLIDRARLAGRLPPRVRAKELWRIAPEYLDQAQDDATIVAIKAQEEAGLDIITDGEMRREAPIAKPGQGRQERREAFAGEACPHEKDQEVLGADPEGEPPFFPPAPADLG